MADETKDRQTLQYYVDQFRAFQRGDAAAPSMPENRGLTWLTGTGPDQHSAQGIFARAQWIAAVEFVREKNGGIDLRDMTAWVGGLDPHTGERLPLNKQGKPTSKLDSDHDGQITSEDSYTVSHAEVAGNINALAELMAVDKVYNAYKKGKTAAASDAHINPDAAKEKLLKDEKIDFDGAPWNWHRHDYRQGGYKQSSENFDVDSGNLVTDVNNAITGDGGAFVSAALPHLSKDYPDVIIPHANLPADKRAIAELVSSQKIADRVDIILKVELPMLRKGGQPLGEQDIQHYLYSRYANEDTLHHSEIRDAYAAAIAVRKRSAEIASDKKRDGTLTGPLSAGYLQDAVGKAKGDKPVLDPQQPIQDDHGRNVDAQGIALAVLNKKPPETLRPEAEDWSVYRDTPEALTRIEVVPPSQVGDSSPLKDARYRDVYRCLLSHYEHSDNVDPAVAKSFQHALGAARYMQTIQALQYNDVPGINDASDVTPLDPNNIDGYLKDSMAMARQLIHQPPQRTETLEPQLIANAAPVAIKTVNPLPPQRTASLQEVHVAKVQIPPVNFGNHPAADAKHATQVADTGPHWYNPFSWNFGTASAKTAAPVVAHTQVAAAVVRPGEMPTNTMASKMHMAGSPAPAISHQPQARKDEQAIHKTPAPAPKKQTDVAGIAALFPQPDPAPDIDLSAMAEANKPKHNAAVQSVTSVKPIHVQSEVVVKKSPPQQIKTATDTHSQANAKHVAPVVAREAKVAAADIHGHAKPTPVPIVVREAKVAAVTSTFGAGIEGHVVTAVDSLSGLAKGQKEALQVVRAAVGVPISDKTAELALAVSIARASGVDKPDVIYDNRTVLHMPSADQIRQDVAAMIAKGTIENGNIDFQNKMHGKEVAELLASPTTPKMADGKPSRVPGA